MLLCRCVCVRACRVRTVDVGCPSFVVAREERVERGNAVLVGRLHAAQGRALQDGRVVGVAHARVALDADVDALETGEDESVLRVPMGR